MKISVTTIVMWSTVGIIGVNVLTHVIKCTPEHLRGILWAQWEIPLRAPVWTKSTPPQLEKTPSSRHRAVLVICKEVFVR